MQTQLLTRKSWTILVELNMAMAMADNIENLHNTSRGHSSLATLHQSNTKQLTQAGYKYREPSPQAGVISDIQTSSIAVACYPLIPF